MPCGRLPGETGEPVEATPRCGHVGVPVGVVAAAGMSDRGSASFHAASHPGGAGPGSRSAPLAAALPEEASPLGIPPSTRRGGA